MKNWENTETKKIKSVFLTKLRYLSLFTFIRRMSQSKHLPKKQIELKSISYFEWTKNGKETGHNVSSVDANMDVNVESKYKMMETKEGEKEDIDEAHTHIIIKKHHHQVNSPFTRFSISFWHIISYINDNKNRIIFYIYSFFFSVGA